MRACVRACVCVSVCSDKPLNSTSLALLALHVHVMCDVRDIVGVGLVSVSPGVNKGGNMAGDLFPLTALRPSMTDLVCMSLLHVTPRTYNSGVYSLSAAVWTAWMVGVCRCLILVDLNTA